MRSAILRRVMVMGIAGMALAAVAETNSIPQYARCFILPKPRLRTGPAEPPAPGPAPGNGQAILTVSVTEMRPADLKTQQTDRFALSAERGSGEAERYYLRQPNFGFIPPARASEDPVVRATEAIFRPEDFRIGRTTTFSCTILTAIKRRDPLCLLNRHFLIITW